MCRQDVDGIDQEPGRLGAEEEIVSFHSNHECFQQKEEVPPRISYIRKIRVNVGQELRVKAATIEKYSPALFGGWQARRVEVDNRQLKWYNKDVLLGALNFDYYWCSVIKDDSGEKGKE